MGSLYRRKQTLSNGEHRELPTWWIKYYRDGRAVRESTGTDKETIARRILRSREGAVEHGLPIAPKVGRLSVEDGAKDLVNDYIANNRRSLDSTQRRIDKHLLPFFRGRRLASARPISVSTLLIVNSAEWWRTPDHERANASATYRTLRSTTN